MVTTDPNELLRQLAGPDASFRPGQREAIDRLVDDHGRVLLVQRTGFGKSAVYLIATHLLREQGAGPTLLFSPLLALMRNQEQMAARLDIQAATLNSANRDDWDTIEDRIRDNEIDMLLISPERLGNPRFRDEVFPHVLSHAGGLVVIDEVHCVSDWGHDFRPDYQRLRRIIDAMPADTPVLGTTATANSRVIEDVESQLGSDLTTIRGGLSRPGLRLEALPRWNKSQRLAWLAQQLPTYDGAGIVYCLTIDDSEQVADWLRQQSINAVAYNGSDDRVAGWLHRHGVSIEGWDGSPEQARPNIEQALVDNRVQVVVATSALGMGFDKPDLAFVIHYQSPGSPIAYYQQVGRAGRALEQSHGVLMRGHEDADIQDYFIDTAFPDQEDVDAVFAALDQADTAMSVGRLETTVNLRRARLEKLLKQLEVDGALERVQGGWVRTDSTWAYDRDRVAAVTALRRGEQAEMEAYAESGACLMSHISGLLDDPDPVACGICSICAPSADPVLDLDLVSAATRFLRVRDHTIPPRRQWPTGLGNVKGRIKPELQIEPGRALARVDDGGWWPVVDRLVNRSQTGSQAGPQPSAEQVGEIATAIVELVNNRWRPNPGPSWVTWIPSTRRPALMSAIAHAVAGMAGVPVAEAIQRVDERPPQADWNNGAQRCQNVLGAFAVRGQLPPGPVLLLDDMVDSRFTLTVIGRQLREAGVDAVIPLTLGTSGAS